MSAISAAKLLGFVSTNSLPLPKCLRRHRLLIRPRSLHMLGCHWWNQSVAGPHSGISVPKPMYRLRSLSVLCCLSSAVETHRFFCATPNLEGDRNIGGIIDLCGLRGWWFFGDSLIKPLFRVTSADVAIICPEWWSFGWSMQRIPSHKWANSHPMTFQLSSSSIGAQSFPGGVSFNKKTWESMGKCEPVGKFGSLSEILPLNRAFSHRLCVFNQISHPST